MLVDLCQALAQGCNLGAPAERDMLATLAGTSRMQAAPVHPANTKRQTNPIQILE